MGESGDLPLTVREGKVWLRDYLKAHSEVSLETIVERITKMAPEISVSEYFGNADIEKPDIQRKTERRSFMQVRYRMDMKRESRFFVTLTGSCQGAVSIALWAATAPARAQHSK